METVTDEQAVDTTPPPEVLSNGAKTPAGSPMREMQRADEADLRSWIASLAGEAPVKVVIRRRKPIAGPNGEKIDGVLETVEDRIDEEYLREMWGGGDYLLQVQSLQTGGKYKYVKGISINIAGDPKMHGVLLKKGHGEVTQTISAADDSPLAMRAFDQMTRLANDERARADRIAAEAGKQQGVDFAALQALNAPLVEQLRTAQQTIGELQAQIISLSTRPAPRDEFRDKILEHTLGNQNATVDSLRSVYEARIEKMRDNFDDEKKRIEDRHAADLRRLEDRHADEIRRMEAAHEREIRQLEKGNDQATKSNETANATRIDSLKDEKSRLERELAAAQQRIATLEAKKDQTISEKADELIKVKEALEGLGGGGEDESPWYEKVLDTIGNSEAAVNLINKIGGGPGGGGGGQPQQQQLPPPGVPFQGPDGNVYVSDAHGNVRQLDQRQLQMLARQQRALAGARRRQRGGAPAQPGAPEAQPAEQGGPPAKVRPPKPAEVKLAVKFMENALNSPTTTPEAFARGARNMIPADILAFIQQVGIDNFLNKVVEPGSPLTTIRGRQFARTVAQILVQGEATPAPAAPAPEEAPADDAEGGELDDAAGDIDLDGGDGGDAG